MKRAFGNSRRSFLFSVLIEDREEVSSFFRCKLTVLAAGKGPKTDIQDSYTFESDDTVTKIFTHSSDLTVETLIQDNVECTLTRDIYLAGKCDRIQDRNSVFHFMSKIIIDRSVNGNDILFVMTSFRTKQAVYDISVIGQKNETCGVLIKSSDRKDPLRVIDIIDDIVLVTLIGRACDPQGLMKSKIDMIVCGKHRLSIDQNDLSREDLGTGDRSYAIDRDEPCFDIFVCFPSGTETTGADIFIDASRVL